MSVPETYSMADVSGKYTMNKSLCDSEAADRILAGQGVGVLKRKALSFVSATMHLKHYKDANGVECIEIEHRIPHGESTPAETRRMTWTEDAAETKLLGKFKIKTRRVALADLDDEYLKNGWAADASEGGLIQSVISGNKWTTIQVWGIEEVKGERRHTRHVKFTGSKGDIIHCRFVYDYLGPV